MHTAAAAGRPPPRNRGPSPLRTYIAVACTHSPSPATDAAPCGARPRNNNNVG